LTLVRPRSPIEDRLALEAPSGGGSNLDAHRDRESIAGAHAVEFSKTAEFLSEKAFLSRTAGPASEDELRADRRV
jgi:hypothetical protein